jgi:hypothetical protein
MKNVTTNKKMIEDEKVIYYLTIVLSVVQRGSMFS